MSKLNNTFDRGQVLSDITIDKDFIDKDQYRPDIQLQIDPIKHIEQLSDEYPILLFPIRLETRFKEVAGKKQLWLRVYPDDCNANLKEELLSDSELDNLKFFWAEMKSAASDERLQRAAWRNLVNSHGAGRAAWMVETYKAAAFDAGSEEIETTLSSWTQAPKALGLPDRFVAIAYQGSEKRSIPFDYLVADNLALGLDPSLGPDEQIKKEMGDLLLNEDLKWMVDFEQAIKVGMAMKIDLSDSEWRSGFSKLFVLGMRFTSNQLDGKEVLEKLITDGYHSNEGFELLRQGTPTNNTEKEGSGYSWVEDADVSFNRVFKGSEEFVETGDRQKKSDGQKLADLLGIDNSFLMKIPHANGCDQLEASAMNQALFPATMGYFMEEMMKPLFSREEISFYKSFFRDFVSGRGPIPAVRFGKQPYGILPVTPFSKINFPREKGFIILNRVRDLLLKMDKSWDEVLPKVSYVGKKGVDPQQLLLRIVGLHSNSVEFYQRYINSASMLNNVQTMTFGEGAAKRHAKIALEKGKKIIQELGVDITDVKLPILEKVFLQAHSLLNGPLVDTVPDSERDPIRAYAKDGKNYLEWLSSSSPEIVRTQNFGGNPAPTALLYLLLRHSLMQAQSLTGSEFLIKEKEIQSYDEMHDKDYINISQEKIKESKFEFLYASFNNKFSGQSLIDYMYQPAVFGTREAKELRETIEALKVLEKTPTARLERLLIEHLDCCNYRIDAWKTALVQFQLEQQRSLHSNYNRYNPDGNHNQEASYYSKGLFLGAYGWLLDVKPENKVLTDINVSSELADVFKVKSGQKLQVDNKNLGYIHAPSIDQAATAAILRNSYDSNKNQGAGNPFAINLSSNRVRIANATLEGMRNGQSLSALLGYQFERGLHDQASLENLEVDEFIYPLRKAFPLVADKLVDTESDTEDSIETIEANNVLDGLKFINHVQKTEKYTYPFGLPNLPSLTGTPEQGDPIKRGDAIHKQLKRIREINDAVSDLVLSEQVYQVVHSNFESVAGSADAFSRGNYPPEMESVMTPRSGVTLTQRMAIHLNADADASISPSLGIVMTARAKAEPNINKWISELLPNPENVCCWVSYSTPNEDNKPYLVSQKDLGMQAIDILFTFNLDTEQAMTEMDDRIAHHIRYEVSNHPKTACKIQYTKPIDASDKSKVSFFELSALVKSLRKILLGSKYLAPSELVAPTTEIITETVLDVGHLNMRYEMTRDGLKVLSSKIEALSAGMNTVDETGIDSLVKDVSATFLEIARYDNAQTGIGFIYEGISGFYDRVFDKLDQLIERWETKAGEFTGTEEMDFNALFTAIKALKKTNKSSVNQFISDVETQINEIHRFDIQSFDVENNVNDIQQDKKMLVALKEDMKAALDDLGLTIKERIAAAEKIQKENETTDNATYGKAILEAFKKLLGEDALVLPRFHLGGGESIEFNRSFDNKEDLLHFAKTKENQIFPVEDWLGGVARVRGKMHAWENTVALATAFKDDIDLDLTPLQFPFEDNDRWLALKFKDENDADDTFKIDQDKLLYTAYFPPSFDKNGVQCGIVIDEWTEVIPGREETTGIAFHYDQPNSEPPQTMLLVTPPFFTGNWNWDTVVEAMEETLDMAKKRAVEPAQIENTSYAQFLPTTMMAVTRHLITAAINLAVNNSAK